MKRNEIEMTTKVEVIVKVIAYYFYLNKINGICCK